MMSGIRAKNTRPEMLVRAFLHRRGFRFRLHKRNLPGSPDIVLPKYGVVIFVHGCFWHRHRHCPKATTPKSNTEKWALKFAENTARDNRNFPDLIAQGWNVIVIWECGLREKTDCNQNLEWLIEAIKTPRATFTEWP
jgi:DNA mismatch endonuclease (patch repair protein)